MPQIDDLDSETLCAIMLELDVRDILACKQISKRFQELAESSSAQYKCQLAFAAAVDAPSRGPGSRECLDALKEYQHAWRTFFLPLNSAFSSTELSEPRLYPFRILKFSGPLIAMHVGSELRLHRPASASRRVEAMTWSIPLARLGQKPLLGASDLGGNVVAICGKEIGNERVFRCNLLSLLPDGTLSPHPLAAQAVLQIPSIHSPDGVVQVVMQGDLLVLSTCFFTSSLYVLNWKTGMILLHLDRIGPFLFYAHILGRDLVLIGYGSELAIYSIDSSHNSLNNAVPICFLQPQSNRFILIGIPSPPSSSSTDAGGLFRPDPDAALLVLHFVLPSTNRGASDYVFCIPRATLLSNTGLSSSDAESSTPSRHIPWEDWARGSALLCCPGIMQTGHTDIAVAASGSRVVVTLNMQQAPGPPFSSLTTVYVFEMHRWAYARDGIVSHAPGEVFDFTELLEGGIERPRDPLPYRISKRDVLCEGNFQETERKFVVLLEDTIALVRENVLEDGEVPTTTHCYMSTA